MDKISALEKKLDTLHVRQNTLEKHNAVPVAHTSSAETPPPESKNVKEKEGEDTDTRPVSDDILKELDNLSAHNQTPEENDPASRRRINRRKKPV